MKQEETKGKVQRRRAPPVPMLDERKFQKYGNFEIFYCFVFVQNFGKSGGGGTTPPCGTVPTPNF